MRLIGIESFRLGLMQKRLRSLRQIVTLDAAVVASHSLGRGKELSLISDAAALRYDGSNRYDSWVPPPDLPCA